LFERAADALIDVGIADRYQSRQEQAAAAHSNERIGNGPHRAIVGKQDSSSGEC
jgi:hypothetical protein